MTLVLESIVFRQFQSDIESANRKLVFRLTFNEGTTNVDPADFIVTGGTTATITDITIPNPNNRIFDVVVEGGDLNTFSGEVGLIVSPNIDVNKISDNRPFGRVKGNARLDTVALGDPTNPTDP